MYCWSTNTELLLREVLKFVLLSSCLMKWKFVLSMETKRSLSSKEIWHMSKKFHFASYISTCLQSTIPPRQNMQSTEGYIFSDFRINLEMIGNYWGCSVAYLNPLRIVLSITAGSVSTGYYLVFRNIFSQLRNYAFYLLWCKIWCQ